MSLPIGVVSNVDAAPIVIVTVTSCRWLQIRTPVHIVDVLLLPMSGSPDPVSRYGAMLPAVSLLCKHLT